jgi:hypothetical protein
VSWVFANREILQENVVVAGINAITAMGYDLEAVDAYRLDDEFEPPLYLKAQTRPRSNATRRIENLCDASIISA